jgi:hypothetical protein
VEEDGLLADLGPLHDGLPLAGLEAGGADAVADLLVLVDALEVADLVEDEGVLVAVDRADAHEHDVAGQVDDLAQAVRRLDVGVRGRLEPADGPGGGEQSGAREQSPGAFHRPLRVG